jgi:hypothetical protein
MSKDRTLLKIVQFNKDSSGISVLPEMDITSFDEVVVTFKAVVIALSKNLFDSINEDIVKDKEAHKEVIKELLIGIVKEIHFEDYIKVINLDNETIN